LINAWNHVWWLDEREAERWLKMKTGELSPFGVTRELNFDELVKGA
jgi:hypothetical protein